MGKFTTFLTSLFPDLVELTKSLFASSGGDVEIARKDIQDRRKEIEARRRLRDRQLEDKYANDD